MCMCLCVCVWTVKGKLHVDTALHYIARHSFILAGTATFGEIKRRASFGVELMQKLIAALLQQSPAHPAIAVQCRQMQRRVALSIPTVYVRPLYHQLQLIDLLH